MKKQSINNETATDGYTLLADAVFRPILFSTPMVQAILDGRKTQTRRIIKSKHESGLFQICKNADGKITSIDSLDWDESILDSTGDIQPKYKVGDIMWVRETFQYTDSSLNINPGYVYRATDPDWETLEGWKWKPSIFMPKEACRIFLEVTNVRVERLQDISNKDIEREGACDFGCVTHRLNWEYLWTKINGKESWEQNPWVWVYDFERIERPLGFC